MKEPVGMIGLGLLGTALAERMLSADIPLVVYNRTKEKAAPLLDRGAVWSDNPLLECDRAVICLYTTATVETVLAQMDAGLHAGQVLIDATTGDPTATPALGQRLARRGVRYLESPIAASSEQTRRGAALAMVAGDEAVFQTQRDVFAAIAPKSFYMGPWGSAAKMKLVNNLILGLNRAALAEGLLFAEAEGLAPRQVLEVLKAGSAYSVVMDVKGRKMIERDFAVQARLAQHGKDIRLVLEACRRSGLALPFTRLHAQCLQSAEDAGLGELDNSAIIQAIEEAEDSGA